MMNSPSMFSVEQLLKARQDGVPDYVVVPMLQKAMAERQAVAQQQALQQGMNQPPPVAQQILGAAQNSVVQDHLARRAQEEQPEARGIDSLRSGIDESDYAGGGIVAFAEGGNTPYQINEEDYAPTYTGVALDPSARKEEYLKLVGTDPNIAKQEARIAERESRLKSEEDKAPWLALMQAGLATMAGTSPNALTNIGEGASKGLAAYGEAKERIGAKADKLDELRSKIEEAQRAEALAAANFGINSVEHREAANEKRALKKLEDKLAAGVAADKYYMNREDNAAALQRANIAAGSSAAALAERRREFDETNAVGGGSAKDVRRTVMNLTNAFTNTKALLDAELAAENPNKKLIGELKYKMNAINDKLSAINSIDTSGYVPEEEPPVEPGLMGKAMDKVSNFFSGPTPKPSAVVKPAIGKTSVSNW